MTIKGKMVTYKQDRLRVSGINLPTTMSVICTNVNVRSEEGIVMDQRVGQLPETQTLDRITLKR